VARHPYVVCDVFTDRPLTGNQLAVFTEAQRIPAELFQPITREMNFSETVFALPPEGGGDVRIRIFTPTAELPFAGHPVLGSAFVLGGGMSAPAIRLETGLGVIPIALDREAGRITFGRMQQPLPSWQPYPRATELLAALGVESSDLPVEVYRNGPEHVFVALSSEAAVAALKPDQTALADFTGLGDRTGLGVNCFAGSGLKWKTRMFGPTLGVAEDPATGSAAGPLAVHLARHGLIRFGDEIEISQGAELRRPSTLYARAEGSPAKIERVEVGGRAVIVARGEFDL
jgi:trans-2,3-dihydro-3-hydroxyanthranilate isomerase